MIPFSIDNPRHYSVKKLKNLNQKANGRKFHVNGNHHPHRNGVVVDAAEIEEIELDTLAEKTHQELLTQIKAEGDPAKLDNNENFLCQVIISLLGRTRMYKLRKD